MSAEDFFKTTIKVTGTMSHGVTFTAKLSFTYKRYKESEALANRILYLKERNPSISHIDRIQTVSDGPLSSQNLE